jgi:hypothetical protein
MTGTQDVSGRRSAASSDGARDAAEAAAPPPDARSMLAALREVVRRAWQTLATLRDPDLHYFRRGGWLFSVVHDVNQAYGYASAQARGFRPSSQDVSRMEVVMHWMAWLRRTEGELALKRIIGWSMGVPKAFGDLDAEPPLIEEAPPQPDRLRAHRSERPTAMQAGTLQPGKLWIDGIGWMFEGRRWNDGSSLAEAAEASHRRRGG